ncbi:MAG: class I SAM-dependent methyltransferase [Burkholderiales bacterium]|nr:class I SAM-dependent methyltransferase [Burkholderiales bacterium]
MIIQIMPQKTEITSELYQYALDIGVKEHPVLRKLREYTAKLENSIMQIVPEQGQFMGLLAKIINAKHYLEIGVFTGYSSLVMALYMGKDSKIVALDNNRDYLQIAQKFWAEAQVDQYIKTMEGNAIESCEQLLASGHTNFFDIAFIDANKNDYLKYYEYCYKLVRPGGLILIDNVLFHGLVTKSNQPNFVETIKELNEIIYQDPRVEISLLPIADGLTIARKKET